MNPAQASPPAVMPTEVGTQTAINMHDFWAWLDTALRRDDGECQFSLRPLPRPPKPIAPASPPKTPLKQYGASVVQGSRETAGATTPALDTPSPAPIIDPDPARKPDNAPDTA